MNNSLVSWSRALVAKRLVLVEVGGFAITVVVCWLTELADPPFSLQQVAIETFVIMLVGAFTVRLTRKLLDRIKYLEGRIVICPACKHVKVEDEWVTIEQLMGRSTDVTVADRVCPDCAKMLSSPYRL